MFSLLKNVTALFYFGNINANFHLNFTILKESSLTIITYKGCPS